MDEKHEQNEKVEKPAHEIVELNPTEAEQVVGGKHVNVGDRRTSNIPGYNGPVLA